MSEPLTTVAKESGANTMPPIYKAIQDYINANKDARDRYKGKDENNKER